MKEIKHPMIIAIGVKEFIDYVDSLPAYYSEEYEGNFKPIGMQMIWEARYIEPPEENTTIKMLDDMKVNGVRAFELWKNGMHLVEAVQLAFKDYLGDNQ